MESSSDLLIVFDEELTVFINKKVTVTITKLKLFSNNVWLIKNNSY